MTDLTYQLNEQQIEKMTEYGIPEYMQGGLIRYFNNRIPPGHFLTAVLENNRMVAFSRADETNREAMHSYCMWLYNQAPGRPHGWGSPEAVHEWLMGDNPLQEKTA